MLFANKYGYFSENGYEYIVTRPDTPRPWTNIICNGDFGLTISQAGGGFTWRTHAAMNRLTRWNQDLISDNWGKWLYLRDLETDEMRSLAYQPIQAAYDHYQVRHGLGYTVFEQHFGSLHSCWTLFAAVEDPVEIWLCTLRNTSSLSRRLQLASYLEWNLGAAPDNHREFHKLFIETKYLENVKAIAATKLLWEVPSERGHWNTEWPYAGFHAVSEPVAGWDTSKDSLIGRNNGCHNPRGIRNGVFTESEGRFEDAVASLAVDLELNPGEEKTIIYVLGQADMKTRNISEEQVRPLIQKYCRADAARAELENVITFWRELTGRTQVKTPDASFNHLVNIWLKYQVFSAHLWGRTGYYQQSGAFGFRDQLQSSQVWLTHDPSQMLEHIKLNARHQFEKGTVLHWWHPLTDKGLVTDMSDDLLWLPFMLMRYLKETADYAALAEVVPYYDNNEGTLQEHCLRAIGVVLDRFSERGLPLIGAGDWCDGFSAIGLDWKGESIWLGMFLYGILTSWAKTLKEHSPRPQKALAATYSERAEKLAVSLNLHGWNGQWYICATRDDGTTVGDSSENENKIYLNSQTWAIINGVANDDRKARIAAAIHELLEGDNGMMLFQPAYSRPDPSIGYVTRYAPGLRENGGVYTHAATWSIQAMTCMGRADDAMRLFRKLNSILQSENDPDRYAAEPYVLPGNIDGKDSDYYGRAGWTWYTGSAGWLYSIALENICGVRAVDEGLLIDPCIPATWEKLEVERSFRGARFHITMLNPYQCHGGVSAVVLNGESIPGNIVPQQAEGSHRVVVTLLPREKSREPIRGK